MGQPFALSILAAESGLASSISFDCTLSDLLENDCIGIQSCWIKGISKHTLFVELIELFMLSFLPGIPVEKGFEFPAGESAEGCRGHQPHGSTSH